MRQAGLELMQLIIDNEVRQTAGERYQRRAPRQPFRWGHEKGFLVVDGQKVPIERPRLRSEDGREQRPGSYELFRRFEPLDDAVWDKLLVGLSTRNYSQAVREFAESYGIEKSAVSYHFMRGSREKLSEILERPLGKPKRRVLYLGGIEFKGQQLPQLLADLAKHNTPPPAQAGRRKLQPAESRSFQRDSGHPRSLSIAVKSAPSLNARWVGELAPVVPVGTRIGSTGGRCIYTGVAECQNGNPG